MLAVVHIGTAVSSLLYLIRSGGIFGLCGFDLGFFLCKGADLTLRQQSLLCVALFWWLCGLPQQSLLDRAPLINDFQEYLTARIKARYRT